MGEEDKKSPEEDSPQIDSAVADAEGEAKEAVTASASAETPAPSLPESEPTTADNKSPEDKKSTAEDTAVTASENEDQEEPPKTPTAAAPASAGDGTKPVAIVASNKKERPPYKYDPNKITLRFLFANKDGLTVTVECKPSDTVGEVKGALLSVWPNGKYRLVDCACILGCGFPSVSPV